MGHPSATPQGRGGLKHHTCTVISSVRGNLPPMHGGHGWVAPARGARASGKVGRLDEKRFGTPRNIEARPSASGARRRSYTRGSE